MPLLRVVLLALTLSWIAAAQAAQPAPTVAAASDLQFALPEIAALFRAQTGDEVKLVFGSSGNLRRQIGEGAPFELFLSADEAFVQALQREGRVEPDAPLYAVGRLALFVPNGSALAADGSLQDLAKAVADGRLRKLAIANPEHAPYGRAAREALTKTGAWPALESKLVLGENVSQAAQFAAGGAAQAGLIAYSLAVSPALSNKGRFALVASGLHESLRQRMALVRGAGRVARAFFAFLQDAPARAVLRRYGFLLPGE
jgi:molybdate transport system substrate-binding protein